MICFEEEISSDDDMKTWLEVLMHTLSNTISPLWVWSKSILIFCKYISIVLGRCYSFKNGFVSLNVHWRKCAERGDYSIYSIIATQKKESKADNDDLGKCFFFSFLFECLTINDDLCLDWRTVEYSDGTVRWQSLSSFLIICSISVFFGKKHTSITAEPEEFLCTKLFLQGGPAHFTE